jgi:uroporphyrinogen-III synthase
MGPKACRIVPPLLGHAIGVTGDRRSEELAAHLEALGASVVHGPVLHMSPIASDQRELRAATEALIARPPDFLVATTGIGVRGWLNAAAAWGLDAALLRALRPARVLARGPKAVGAVAEAGLDVWFTEPSGQTGAVIDHLLRGPIAGAHVGIQLPGAAMPDVVRRVREQGADVTGVPIYDWTWPADLGPARRLLRAIVDGRVAAVTFTSRPAVRNLVALASADGVADQLADALTRVAPVCIGAVTADALFELTGALALTPERARLGMLAPAVAAAVHRHAHRHVRTPTGDVIVQGRLVARGAVSVMTSAREAAVLDQLLDERERTVGRAELLQSVWRDEDVDPSVLDTTVARLRRRIAKTGLDIQTITGRGYLLGGERVRCPSHLSTPIAG